MSFFPDPAAEPLELAAMTSWTRLMLPSSVVLLLAACNPTPDEVTSTSGADTSSSTSAGPGPTTPGTTMPGEDTVGTVGVTGTDTTSSVDTTVGVSITEGTTVDPSTSDSSSGGESSSTTGDPPKPECMVPDDCPNNETCNGAGECESVCAASGWGPNDYIYGVTPLGTFDSTTICGEMVSCVVGYNGADEIDTAVCGRSCTTPCDCPAPAASGDATVSCGNVTGDGTNRCYLSCDDGETCPGDMTCRPGQMGSPDYCTYTVQPIEPYGNCDGFAAGCAAGSTCSTSGANSVCTPLCPGGSPAECPAAPPGGNVDCDTVISPPDGNDCHLDCFMADDCPDGMSCVNAFGNLCMWP